MTLAYGPAQTMYLGQDDDVSMESIFQKILDKHLPGAPRSELVGTGPGGLVLHVMPADIGGKRVAVAHYRFGQKLIDKFPQLAA